MKKRILSILLAVLMLLSALPLGMVDTAYAAALASGKCGDSATWTLDSTGTLTISGTGATYNYDMDDDGNSAAPWCTKARIQRVNKVVVNSGITELGYSMFSNCTQLTSVSLPSGLKRIGSCLFLGCIRLSAITIPSSVTTIESNAFTHCDSIAAITLPSGLRTMGDAVCSQMAKLTTATVSGGVTYLSNYAFNDCPSLKTITLPNTVKSIGICAFRYDTALKDVYFNGSVTQWTSIQIAGEGNSALYNADVHCTGLSAPTVTGGNDAQGRPTLKWNAVTGAAKYEVYRARSMDGDYIKYSTVTSTSYTNISYIENGNTYYYKVRALDANGTAGAWSSIVSVTYRAASTGTLSAPAVTGGNDAQGRPTLKWNAVSGAAKYEVYRSYSRDGSYSKYSTQTSTAYTNSSYLTSGTTYYYKVRALDANGNAGPYSAAVSVTCRLKLTAPTVTGGNDAQGRPTLKWNAVAGAAKYEVYRARSMNGDYIKYSTVTGTSYTNISYIENGNTYYYKVRALKSDGTAGAWSSIVSVTYRKPAAATVASGKCGDSAKWTLDAAGTLTISGTGATYDFFNDYNCTAPWYDAELRLQIKKAVVNKGITYVGTWAFRDCAELTSVSLPAGLEEMGSSVFMDCTSLTSVTIPDGVTFISGDFFRGCTSLKSVTLPDSLRETGGCTFMYCTSLTSVRLPATLLSISWQMFKDCKSLTSLTIPRSVVDVKQDAFSGCTALKNVTYTGTTADWKALTIYSGNEALTRANVRCTGSTVLTAPTLTLSVSKKGQPTLKWSAVSGAAGYQIWCSYDSGDGTGPWYHWLTNLDKGTASFTDDRELKKGQTYTYKVRAVTSSGAVGSFSKEVTFTYNPAASLAAPTVTAGLDDQGYPALTWPAVPDAARYEVYRAASEVTLGDSLFQECENLTDVTLPADLTVIGPSMFENCGSLKNVTIPSGVTHIGNAAFAACEALPEIRLPDGMEALGSEAFVGCRAVTKVYIPRSLTSIGEAAFRICEGLTDVYYGGTAAEWAAISVADRNDPLLNAALHCTGQSASRLDVPAMTLGEDCSDGKPTVWWPAVTGAERYEIWRAQAASDGSAPAASAYTLIVSADVTFHKDTTAEADTWYYYKVRAVSGSTYSDFSQAARRYCEAPPTMDTPEITSLELDDSGKPVLTWRTVEGAARYQVFRSEDDGFSYSPMGTVLPTGSDTITWTDTTAVSGTGYYYGVGCYDDNGHYSSFGGGEWWVTAR